MILLTQLRKLYCLLESQLLQTLFSFKYSKSRDIWFIDAVNSTANSTAQSI